MTSIKRLTCVSVLVMAWMSTCPALGQTSKMNRWAVLSSPAIRDTGLSELVTTELGGAGLELVERDLIEQVTRELTFAQVLGSAGGPERLRLGRLLRADVLLILDVEKLPSESDAAEPETRPAEVPRVQPGSTWPQTAPSGAPTTRAAKPKDRLRVVISECTQGSRLRVEQIPFEVSEAARAAATVREVAGSVREKYAGGIRCVVGVSNLVSRTLLHDYDYLQSSFGYVLGNALSSVPGVAVIEVEEAQSIRQERGTAGGSEAARLVPLLVEGEYRVDSAPGKQAEVEIKVRFNDGNRTVHSLEAQALSIQGAAEYLRKEGLAWARKLSGSEMPTGSFSVDEQVRFMATQAEAFASLSLYEQSVGLREACLLLAPDEHKQRILLIGEYGSLLHALWKPLIKAKNLGDPSAKERILALYTRSMGHSEELVRRGAAGAMSLPIVAGQWEGPGCYHPMTREKLPPSLVDMKLIETMEAMKSRFLFEYAPRVLVEEQSQAFWEERLLHLASSPTAPISIEDWRPREMKLVVDLLTRILSESKPLAAPFVDYVKRACKGYPPVPLAEVRGFIEALQATRVPRNILLARLGQLNREVLELSRKTPTVPEVLLAEADDLVAQCPAEEKEIRRFADEVRKSLRAMARLSPTESRPWGRSKPSVIPVGGLATGPSARLLAEPMAFDVTDPLGRVRPLTDHPWNKTLNSSCGGVLSLTTCGETGDVFWNEQVVLMVDAPGLLRQLLAYPRGRIRQVVWDGGSLWIGTRQQGITVITPSNGAHVRIDKDQGLPPYDQGMLLYPVEPGKVLAVGSFDDDRRAWCAIITCGNAGGRVHIFHQALEDPAKNMVIRNDLGGGNLGLNARFAPQYILPDPQPPAGQENSVFVSRSSNRFGQALLRIDLKTLTVSLPDEKLERSSVSEARFMLANGIRLQVDETSAIRWAPPGMTFAGGKSWYRLPDDLGRVCSPYVLPIGDYTYIPGRTWYRIHRQTGLAERMDMPVPFDARVPARKPSQLESAARPTLFGAADEMAVGLSGRYGLIAWNAENKFARLRIIEPEQPATRPAGMRLVSVRPATPRTSPTSQVAQTQPVSPPGGGSPSLASENMTYWAFLPISVAGAVLLVISLIGVRRMPERCPRCSAEVQGKPKSPCQACGAAVVTLARRPRWGMLVAGSVTASIGGYLAVPFVSEMMGYAQPRSYVEAGADPDTTRVLNTLLSPVERMAGVSGLCRRMRDGSLSSRQADEAISALARMYTEERENPGRRLEMLRQITDALAGGRFTLQRFEPVLRQVDLPSARCRFDEASGRLLLHGKMDFPEGDSGVCLACRYEVDRTSGGASATRLLEGVAVGDWALESSDKLDLDQATQRLDLRITRKWCVVLVRTGEGVARPDELAAANSRSLATELQDVELERSDYRSMITDACYWSIAAVFVPQPSPAVAHPPV